MATREEVRQAVAAYEDQFGYLPNEHDMAVIVLMLDLNEELA